MRKPFRIAYPILICLLSAPSSLSAQDAWKLYEFTGTENFTYSIRHATSDGVEEGQFHMGMTTSGGQTTATVAATLGDANCQSTMPISSPQMMPQQMMMQCMMIAPVTMTMFAPTWAMFMGQNWQIGSKMSMGQGSNQFSFEVSEVCSHAGVDGVLAQIISNEVQIESCVAVDVALPLAVKFTNSDRGEETEITLTSYTP
jgi:hypothetical protein